jgi:hypothetical protein
MGTKQYAGRGGSEAQRILIATLRGGDGASPLPPSEE